MTIQDISKLQNEIDNLKTQLDVKSDNQISDLPISNFELSERTANALEANGINTLGELAAMTDEEAEAAALADPDAQPLVIDEEFWKNARAVMPVSKMAIHIRVDSDVLEWFKSQGKGYQTRMNAVLRSYMNACIGESQE